MPDDIHLQLLLRRQWRSDEGVARVHLILKSLGFHPTGSGRVSVSARADAHAFTKTFGIGVPLTATPSKEHKAPFRDSPTLTVPEDLVDYVDSVTIAPPHIRF